MNNEESSVTDDRVKHAKEECIYSTRRMKRERRECTRDSSQTKTAISHGN